jgi:hypothetical protein
MLGRILGAVTLRELTNDERAILALLLRHSFPGQPELAIQAEMVRTSGLSCSCGCPSISLVVDGQAPAAPVTDRVPVDAYGRDTNGSLVGVLLFVDDGYMSELEFYNHDDAPPGIPRLETLRIAEWSERDRSGTRWLLNEPPP